MPQRSASIEPRSAFIRLRVTPVQREQLRGMAEQDQATESDLVRRLIADEVRRRSAQARRPGKRAKGGRS